MPRKKQGLMMAESTVELWSGRQRVKVELRDDVPTLVIHNVAGKPSRLVEQVAIPLTATQCQRLGLALQLIATGQD